VTRIGDLLDRSFSRPVEETINIENDDPYSVFTELTEYVATDRIQSQYECLFSAMAEAPGSPNEAFGVWISGFFGSGKSSFAKNLGYVLASREVNGASASSLLLKQVGSQRLAECIARLNRKIPYEVFMFGVERKPQANREPAAEVMYRSLLRGLDYAEEYDIAEIERELEDKGKLAVLEDLCRMEYNDEWRKIRNGGQRLAHTSALLHRLDPRTYPSADQWLNQVTIRQPAKLRIKDLVEKSFALCEIRRPGRSFAFIADQVGDGLPLGGERPDELCAVVEQFGKQSRARLKAGKIPGPVWIIVTSQDKLPDAFGRVPGRHIDLPKLEKHFQQQIDLCAAGIGTIASRRVLRKKESEKPLLRKLFREHGASLRQSLKLEHCSRQTDFDEDQFVEFYPYLPLWIDLSKEILARLLSQPNAQAHLAGGNRTIVKQCFDMLLSDRVQLGDQPVGELVSIDKIYELVEGIIPWPKRKDVRDIGERFDEDLGHPGLASRVAKAICLMEFVQADLPRTTKNIAALLVRYVGEVPLTDGIAEILDRLETARFVRHSQDGWTLYDFEALRGMVAALQKLEKAAGTGNSPLAEQHNHLVRLGKKVFACLLTWYVRPWHKFNASVRRSLEEIFYVLERRNLAVSYTPEVLNQLSLNVAALEARVIQSERRNATSAAALQKQLDLLQEQLNQLVNLQPASAEVPAGRVETESESSGFSINTDRNSCRTTYIIGLFGTGRLYINELLVANLGERAKYLKDTIRLHPGPTPMIYSGHATVKYISRAQELPAVTSCIREAVRLGFANLIFLYRHPLDSLLTNWVWWRTYIRDNRAISGISQIYRNTDDLCADLDRNFPEFLAFAEGDPAFFRGLPGPRFLSFPEFVEETELHRQFTTIPLRLEDFMIDPHREFDKLLELVAADVDPSGLTVPRPRAQAFGHLAVKERLPSFRSFVDGLDAETKRRIERVGYPEVPR
jgi:hypothetical protein